MCVTSGPAVNRDHETEQMAEVVHELGNVSLLIDAALRLTETDGQLSRLLVDARRRIDDLVTNGRVGDAVSR